MSRAQREKGKRGERKVANALRAVYPDAARDLNDVYNGQGVDLINTGGFAVQVKHYAKHVPLTKMHEIQPADGRMPLLVSWPTNGDEPVACLRLSDLVRVLQDIGVAYDDGGK